MKTSFEERGFTDDCEYLIADNCQGNQFDAYSAIRHFLQQARGKYLIIVHQDVRCLDNREQLTHCLAQLTAMDTRWAVCGNAGCMGYHEDLMHINIAGKIVTSRNLPGQVSSLDENLLIVNADARLTLSADLRGFHLYGTDICIIAHLLGYTCYVIPFMVKHLSFGNLKDLKKHIHLFTDAYGKKLQSRFIATTCTKFYIGDSVFTTRLLNAAPFFFFVKLVQRIKQLRKLARLGDVYKTTTVYEEEKPSSAEPTI
ncbi:MAG TPA: hypothetical protein VL307_17610 [Chitinophagaceae bacterium]|nr:hypothetical protein [Chitinophagaceae bacterium]